MKDEQIIALYFARNEDAIGETDKKYGARLLQLAQRILLDQFACEEVRSDTYTFEDAKSYRISGRSS